MKKKLKVVLHAKMFEITAFYEITKINDNNFKYTVTNRPLNSGM